MFPIFLMTSTGLINSLFPFCSHQILRPNRIYQISFSLINVVFEECIHSWKCISFFVSFRSSYSSLVLYMVLKKDAKTGKHLIPIRLRGPFSHPNWLHQYWRSKCVCNLVATRLNCSNLVYFFKRGYFYFNFFLTTPLSASADISPIRAINSFFAMGN